MPTGGGSRGRKGGGGRGERDDEDDGDDGDDGDDEDDGRSEGRLERSDSKSYILTTFHRMRKHREDQVLRDRMGDFDIGDSSSSSPVHDQHAHQKYLHPPNLMETQR